MRRIYLATGNAHKVQEFQQLAETSRLAIEFVRPLTLPSVAEDTGTFAGNARKKALALKAVLPPETWVLADDSGLCVDALGGAPGVESAYYAGSEGNPRANLEKLTQVMAGVPSPERGAHFICVLVLLREQGRQEEIMEGRCDGALLREPAGGGGFGYDPLFVPEGYAASYAEISAEAKNAISHRARAFGRFARWLMEINAQGSVG